MKNRLFIQVVLCVVVSLNFSLNAQYDTAHYIPPIYSRLDNVNDLGAHLLFLSTNEVTPFDVTITETNGTLISVENISKINPVSVNLGAGWSAINLIDATQLNTPLAEEGLLLTAASPFFANIRQRSNAQGFSLTSKGSFALGTRFRLGHMYSNKAGYNHGKSHMVSVMATEDNTEVNFSDISSGVIFFGTPTTGTTSDNISVTLDENESYVIAAHMDEPNNMGNDTLLNGMLVTSTKPIVVNTGTLLGGSDLPSGQGRDVGADQIVGIDRIGDEYIVVQGTGGIPEQTEKTLVIADADNTNIFLNGNNTAPYASIDAGEFKIIPHTEFINDVLYLKTSENVFVYQTTNSNPTAVSGVGLNFIPPISCAGTQEVTIGQAQYLGSPGIDLVSKVGATIQVQGGAVALPASIAVTGNPNWEVYRLDKSTVGLTGDINIVSNKVMNVSLYTAEGVRGAAGYFSGFSNSEGEPVVNIESLSGSNTIVEDCNSFRLIFGKGGIDFDIQKKYNLTIEGTATNGDDYTFIENEFIIPANKDADTLIIDSFGDNITENEETIVITVNFLDQCGDTVYVSDTLRIADYQSMTSSVSENDNICEQFNETSTVEVFVENGAPPYFYLWGPTGATTASTVVAPNETTQYIATVQDQCGNVIVSDPITIYVQCPIKAPNVFTPGSDDEINQFLSFKNLDDYQNVGFTVMNRWGQIVYEDENYLNNWNGVDKGGDALSEGVYYYVIDVESTANPLPKFEVRSFSGVFHIVRPE